VNGKRRFYLGIGIGLWCILSFTALIASRTSFFGVQTIRDFSFLIPDQTLLTDSWYGIYFRDAYIGYAHYYMAARDMEEGGGYIFKNNSQLSVSVLGQPQDILMQSQLLLDNQYTLQQGSIALDAGMYFLELDITPDDQNRYRMRMKTPSETTEQFLPRGHAMISFEFLPLNTHYIPLGKNVSLEFFDPLMQKQEQIYLTNKGKVSVPMNGESIDAIQIDLERNGASGTLYVDENGELLKGVFLGFTFIKQDFKTIKQLRAQSRYAGDLDSFTIPSFEIPSGKFCSSLTVRIKKKQFNAEPEELSFFNQKVRGCGNDYCMTIKKIVPQRYAVLPLDTESMEEELAQTHFIKVDDPRIKRLVKEIIGTSSDTQEIIQKIHLWIDSHIQKVPTFSLPNTLDVLTIGQGDCGELSVLMVGFLRAAGIPSYVNIGLVHQNGRFFYHAWPSVYVGQWIDTDPALSQDIADATHIKFFRGLDNQFEIIKILGDLEIEVTDYDCD